MNIKRTFFTKHYEHKRTSKKHAFFFFYVHCHSPTIPCTFISYNKHRPNTYLRFSTFFTLHIYVFLLFFTLFESLIMKMTVTPLFAQMNVTDGTTVHCFTPLF